MNIVNQAPHVTPGEALYIEGLAKMAGEDDIWEATRLATIEWVNSALPPMPPRNPDFPQARPEQQFTRRLASAYRSWKKLNPGHNVPPIRLELNGGQLMSIKGLAELAIQGSAHQAQLLRAQVPVDPLVVGPFLEDLDRAVATGRRIVDCIVCYELFATSP